MTEMEIPGEVVNDKVGATWSLDGGAVLLVNLTINRSGLWVWRRTNEMLWPFELRSDTDTGEGEAPTGGSPIATSHVRANMTPATTARMVVLAQPLECTAARFIRWGREAGGVRDANKGGAYGIGKDAQL